MPPLWTIREVSWPQEVTAISTFLDAEPESVWLDSGAAFSAPDSPLKNGDWLAAGVRNPAEIVACGVPVPIFQPGDRNERFSLVGLGPVATIEQGADATGRLVAGGVSKPIGDTWDFWTQLVRRQSAFPPLPHALGPGWIGYLGFEFSARFEPTAFRVRDPNPAHKVPNFPNANAFSTMPLLRMSLYDTVIVLDHAQRQARMVRAEDCGTIAALGLDLQSPSLDQTQAAWERAITSSAIRRESAAAAPRRPACAALMSSIEYQKMIRKAREYIAAGDIYQVNLAQCLEIEPIIDPIAAYVAMRRANPGTFGALLRRPGWAVASVSPELLLRVRGREVLTSPIKGTRPRTGDPQRDTAALDDLIRSPKDAAELAMIVDLHRNDLGRACEPGSVRVAAARRVEHLASVIHTVADVTGRLAAGRDALDLLAACFPAGSVSGVPKIRAMQIIRELEPVARGVYTGAIGYVGLDGQMTMNVAIRTLQIAGDVGRLHVGGGIVADSNPEDEYAETFAKARGILDGLGVRSIAGDIKGQSTNFLETARSFH